MSLFSARMRSCNKEIYNAAPIWGIPFPFVFPPPQLMLITSKRYRKAHSVSICKMSIKLPLVSHSQQRCSSFLPFSSAWWSQALPFQQFQVLLTLFPKFFSSFPHGTCSLSVSHQYLALCETYHTFCVQFPRNATLRKCTVRKIIAEQSTGLSPSLTFFSKKLLSALSLAALLKTTIQKYNKYAFPIFTLSCSLFIRHY